MSALRYISGADEIGEMKQQLLEAQQVQRVLVLVDHTSLSAE